MSSAKRPVHTVTCLENLAMAADQRLLTVDAAGLASPHALPGQVVEAEVDAARAYFVVASPVTTRPRLQILLRLGGGGVADRIATTQPGTAIAITDPFGPGFPLEPACGLDVLLVVTGTGIAAVRPLLHSLEHERGSLETVKLYYGVRTHAHVAFALEIETLVPRGLLVRFCLSDAAPVSPHDRRGRVQDVLREEPPDLRDTVVYVAGHREMTRELAELCRGWGLADGRFLSNF
jgi:NAD(P)H-flavin reductase